MVGFRMIDTKRNWPVMVVFLVVGLLIFFLYFHVHENKLNSGAGGEEAR